MKALARNNKRTVNRGNLCPGTRFRFTTLVTQKNIIASDPEKFDWELKEFQGQFSIRN